MKNMKILVIIFVVALTPAIIFAGNYSSKAKMSQDIVDTAITAGSFNTLVTAVKAADLVEVLKGKGPFTVFAPTDDAFAKLPEETLNSLLQPENKEKLQSILTYHVVPGKYTASDIMGMGSAKTVNGESFSISKSGGNVMVDNAKVIKTDVMASNGVIHVIDTVIIPKNM
jgi:uncharacterized surface protein with fasciclin (FAS1) repeats